MEYRNGDVVWAKLGPCWWPGEVWGEDRLPPGILKSLRKAPIAVVKFFQEDAFEYIKNNNFIFPYDCSRKNEFIKKGLDLFRSGRANMENFPGDVSTAESKTGGNPDIVDGEEFLPEKKESYANIFGTPTDSANAKKPGSGKRGRPSAKTKWISGIRDTPTSTKSSPKITHHRILQKYAKGTSDYKVHILVQPNKNLPDDIVSSEESKESEDIEKPEATPKYCSPSKSSENYTCHSCSFTTTRLNVMVLHHKSHSVSFTPYTPKKIIKTPVISKSKSKSSGDEDRKKPSIFGSRSRGRPKSILNDDDKIASSPPKRKSNKSKEKEVKKPKTDEEIKNSLLADWNEDSDDDSMNVLTTLKLTENQNSTNEKTDENKPNSESSRVGKRDHASCFDFEEEDDLQIENIGKKIPRLGKSEDTKKPTESSEPNVVDEISNLEDTSKKQDLLDLDSEIDSLLQQTAVPELPSLPSDSNFQKNKVVKPPDKENATEVAPPPTKTIFKTKTFFRSRHSRSQDAIEKYVADNIDKPPTYMEEPIEAEKTNDHSSDSTADQKSSDSLDNENKVDSKPESVRVTKYAPKIQLKKMSAALSKNKSMSFEEGVNDFTETKTLPKSEEKISDEPDLKQNPTESDIQIAEALVSLPSSTFHEEKPSKQTAIEHDKNINTAKLLVQMSESVAESKEPEKSTIEDLNAKNSSQPSKLYEILDSSNVKQQHKAKSPLKIISTKIIKPQQGKEKILNFNVGSSPTLSPGQNQKIIIRRSTASIKTDSGDSAQNIILKSTEKWDKKEVQTFTIEGTSGSNEDLLDPKIKKVTNVFPKKPSSFSTKLTHNAIITPTGEIIQASSVKQRSDTFDINDMPITFIEENKAKCDKFDIPKKTPESPLKKSIIVKSVLDKISSPNILSKSKTKPHKRMICIDENTGEKKYVMSSSTDETNIKKENVSDQKLLSPKKVIPSKPESNTGEAIMIITNQQGEQSKILLSPEHRKLLFPKGKIAPNSQIIITSKASTGITPIVSRSKSHVTVPASGQLLNPGLDKSAPKIVQKSKSAIINSKGQIIFAGSGNKRTILTTMPGQAILTSKGHLIAPQSSVVTSTSKLMNAPVLEKRTPPLQKVEKTMLLNRQVQPQQKQIMHYLTAAEFEHLKKTGQLVSSNKPPTSGKVTQRYILQNVSKPTMTDVKKPSIVDKQQQQQIKKPSNDFKTQVQNVNALPDPNDNLDNLDSLIPATIIPRKSAPNKDQVSSSNNVNIKKAKEAEKPVENKVDESQLNALADSQKQLLAIPGENFGGPPNSFFLCMEENGTLTPIDNQPLVLENNQLVPMGITPTVESDPSASLQTLLDIPLDQQQQGQQNFLINIGDQQILLDQQTLTGLLAGEGQSLVMNDGQQLVFQGNPQQIIAALSNNSELSGLLSQQQESQMIIASEGLNFSGENQDILAAALAGTEVFQQDSLNIVTSNAEGMLMEIDSLSPNLQGLNAAAPVVHSNVIETSSTLNQPIMSPLETPTKKPPDGSLLAERTKNLEDSLAIIGVSTANVPTSLELPITVTNPRIAVKTTSPLSLSTGSVYQSVGLINSMISPTSSLFDSEALSTNLLKDSMEVIDKQTEDSKSKGIVPKDVKGSSMPCLDDSSSESFLTTQEIQTKTYSPISMPILTEDIMDVSESKTSVGSCNGPDNLAVNIQSESPGNIAESQPAEDLPGITENIVEDTNEKVNDSTMTEIEKPADIVKCDEDQSNANMQSAEESSQVMDSDKNQQDANTSASNINDSAGDIDDSANNINDYVDKINDKVASESNDDKLTSGKDSPLEKTLANEDVCADTPPALVEHDSCMYEDEPMERVEAEGNSLPDHVDDTNITELATLPDSTSLNLTSEPSQEDTFSDTSSNDSTEIPIQPVISVSQHIVQNFSSILNNADENNENGSQNAISQVDGER